MTDTGADATDARPRWESLEHVIDRALDVAPSERAAVLARLCGADAALRVEAKRLLEEIERMAASNWLEIPVTDRLRPDELATAARSDESPNVPETIGRYRVKGCLGRGAAGVVFSADDPVLGRPVAIKQLLASWIENPEALERFRREARAIAAIAHPRVCAIYDAGSDDSGRPYIVMEFLDGTPLDVTLASEARLPLDRALDIAHQTAVGIRAVHESGAFHRDIKPSNLFQTRSGEVKILDFGIARLSAEEGLTRTGMILGTAPYMSPEQVLGVRVDARTDWWSLGVVLYEMLTGEPPFLRADVASTLEAILNDDLPDPRRVRPELPPRVVGLVSQLLSREAEERLGENQDPAADLGALAPQSFSG